MSTAASSLRREVLDQAFASPERTLDHLATHGRFVATAFAGLSPATGRKAGPAYPSTRRVSESRSSVAVMVCFELSGYLQDHPGTSEETLTQFAHQLVARMEHQQDLGRLRQLATGIMGRWMPASPSGTGRSAERLVKEIEDTKSMTLRSRLAESFAGPAKRISESNAGELIQRLVVVIVMEAGFELRSRVVSGIQTRGRCVSAAKADEFAERYLGSMDRDETVFRLACL